LVDGVDETGVPIADPHAPLIATGAGFTVIVVLAVGDVPPAPMQASV
jgi:hypothetical protein